MNVYRVDLSTIAYVLAEDESQAQEIARRDSDQIVRDAGDDLEIIVFGTVKSLDELLGGWDGMCLPYSDGGRDIRLQHILGEAI